MHVCAGEGGEGVHAYAPANGERTMAIGRQMTVAAHAEDRSGSTQRLEMTRLEQTISVRRRRRRAAMATCGRVSGCNPPQTARRIASSGAAGVWKSCSGSGVGDERRRDVKRMAPGSCDHCAGSPRPTRRRIRFCLVARPEGRMRARDLGSLRLCSHAAACSALTVSSSSRTSLSLMRQSEENRLTEARRWLRHATTVATEASRAEDSAS